jgi:hypothetical protein
MVQCDEALEDMGDHDTSAGGEPHPHLIRSIACFSLTCTAAVAWEAELKNEPEHEDAEVGVARNFHDVKFRPPAWE